MSRPTLPWSYLGLKPYQQAWDLQNSVREGILAGKKNGHLFLLQHPPTLTLGRGEKGTNLSSSPDSLQSAGFDVTQTNRGGQVTYHGPGQLIFYPVIHLRDFNLGVKQFVHHLEEIMIDFLARFDLDATRHPDYPGAWVDEKKIGSIGIHVRKQVTTHGLALNIQTDLGHFAHITPCGIAGVKMTSMAAQGVHLTVENALIPFVDSFARTFHCDLKQVEFEPGV